MNKPSVTKPHLVAVGYCRVSTDKQADHGISLDAQNAKVRAMAELQDAHLLEVIVDGGESAKSLQRPGLQRMLSLVDAGKVGCVIVAKLDRLTRSVVDLAELLKRFERRGVALISVAESLDTGTAAGRLVLNIMVSVSQWEREAIGERTAAAIHHKRALRKVYSRLSPFGYERDGDRLVPVEAEQSVIATIREYRAQGMSLRQIARELNRQGVATKLGREWLAQTVANVLDSPLNVAA